MEFYAKKVYICAVMQAFLVANCSFESVFLMSFLMISLCFLFSNCGKGVLNFKLHVLVILLQVLCGLTFYRNWLVSDTIELISKVLQIPSIVLVVVTAVVLAFLGYWFQVNLVKNFLLLVKSEAASKYPNSSSVEFRTWKQRFLFCFICAVISITFCSQNSFLYPLNSWTDPHCFMTVGKVMMNGMVLYRDLLEQKGPVLYFIYGVTWLFSKSNYAGIYLLEIIAASLFLYYASITVSLFRMGKDKLAILLTAFIIYTSWSFRTGGTAEELCIPLLAYALYMALSSLRNHKELTWKNFIVIGLSIGFVFWVKYTFVGFYFGWVLFFGLYYVKKSNLAALQKMLSGLLLGFIFITLPVIFYFGYHHALHDMVKVYFYDNIFLYTAYDKNPFFEALLHYGKGFIQLIRGNYPALLLICVSCYYEKNRLLTLLFITLFATSFLGWRTWPYYSLIFAPFVSVGIGVILDKVKFCNSNISSKPAIVLLCLLCLIFTPNHCNIGRSKEDTPQYQFAKIIRESNNPTLLNYGFLDGGFYWAADILPNCKAFCKLMNPIEEMLQLQEEYVRQGKSEFVVTRGQTIDAPMYRLIRKSENYYLYRRVE